MRLHIQRWAMCSKGEGTLCTWVWSPPPSSLPPLHASRLLTLSTHWCRQHYYRPLPATTTVGRNSKLPPSVLMGSGRTQTKRGLAVSPQERPCWFISYKLHVEGSFTISKEQTKEYVLLPGLGYHLSFIFPCFEKNLFCQILPLFWSLPGQCRTYSSRKRL